MEAEVGHLLQKFITGLLRADRHSLKLQMIHSAVLIQASFPLFQTLQRITQIISVSSNSILICSVLFSGIFINVAGKGTAGPTAPAEEPPPPYSELNSVQSMNS